MPDPATFFTDTEKQELVRTIRTAEKLTSGEIRLHVEERCKGDAFKGFTGICPAEDAQNSSTKRGAVLPGHGRQEILHCCR